MKTREKSVKMNDMKKFLGFLICAVLIMVVVRIGMFRYQDRPEDFAGIEKWIDLGREKTEEVTDNLSEKISGLDWEFEGAYDIEADSWFDEDGIIYSGNLEYTKIDTGNVKQFVLQSAGCKVEVMPVDEEDFYISFENMKKVQVYQKEETLHLRAVRETTIGEESQEHILRVYVPKDCALKLAEIELGAGSMMIECLEAEQMKVSVEAGKMEIKSLIAKESQLSVGAGTLLVADGDLGSAEISVGAGNLSLNGEIRGNMDAECAVGNLQMQLSGNKKDFNYELQCVAGNIMLDDEKHTGINEGMVIDHAAEKKMELDCALGNMKIEFVQ